MRLERLKEDAYIGDALHALAEQHGELDGGGGREHGDGVLGNSGVGEDNGGGDAHARAADGELNVFW